MEINVFQRIQRSLVEKSANLNTWLSSTEPAERQTRFGPAAERDMHAHLEVLESAQEKAAEQSLGCCEVCHSTVDTDLLEMDYQACVCLEHLSAHERRDLESELEFSQQVQQALLPQHAPVIPGLSLAAFTRPAQIVSGDYFDFFEFADHTPGMVIADAMGHGISASLIVTSLQSALRNLVPDSYSPAATLERVNRFYLHNSHFTTFVTVFLGQYDPHTRRLTYVNAGHNPPLLYRARDGRAEWLAPTGAAIGLVENNPLGAAEARLEAGDILLLYTDGLTEASNAGGEAFGSARLEELLARPPHRPRPQASELVSSLRQALGEFTNGSAPADDVTWVAVCVE